MGRRPFNDPPCSLVVLQKELEHRSLLVEELELRFGLTCVAEIAFGELNPARTAGLVGHHGLHIVEPPFGLVAASSGRRRCQKALRVGDHPIEASQFVLESLVRRCWFVSFICVSPFRKGNGIVYVMTHMSHAVRTTSSQAFEDSSRNLNIFLICVSSHKSRRVALRIGLGHY